MTEYKHVHAYNWYHIDNKKEVTMGIMGVWYLNWKLFTLEIGAKNYFHSSRNKVYLVFCYFFLNFACIICFQLLTTELIRFYFLNIQEVVMH